MHNLDYRDPGSSITNGGKYNTRECKLLAGHLFCPKFEQYCSRSDHPRYINPETPPPPTPDPIPKYPHSAMGTIPLPIFLLFLSLPAMSEERNPPASPGKLATCLSSAQLTNYTIPSVDPTDAAMSSYYRVLNFSIQNLRFARPSLPKPAAVVLPDDTLQLRSTVICCRRANLGIRIRSGGHSYEGLSYTAGHDTPFVIIDLMNMNRVWVDPENRTAWVESGATLGETYHAIAKASDSIAFSAGSCPTVGSGGHIAGGGFGLLSRKYGLAADNVLDAILVDPSGRVLDRKSMGDDVFWAIRGGGGGTWGAVYAWKIRLLPVRKRVTAFIINRPGSTQAVAELLHKWQRVSPSLPDEFYLSCFVGAGLPELDRIGMSATFKGFYLGPKPEAVAILNRRFAELNLSDSELHEMSWIESVVFFSGLPKGSSVSDLKKRILHTKTFFKAKSDYVREPISKRDLVRALDLLSDEPKACLILDPYGGAMATKGSEDLPFPHRRGNLYAIQYLVEWTADDDGRRDEYMEWIRGFYGFMGEFVSKGPRAAYVNYLDLDLGNTGWTDGSKGYSDPVAEARVWGERYFLGNFDRLVRAKTAVDPDNVFRNEQSIPPLGLGSVLDREGKGTWDDDHGVCRMVGWTSSCKGITL
ncbi:reticuline oxidase-like [Phoenix dactylifera]|uniref:Reticuline oxidase-like n=1 Tax=Phoenix dactylifera TaxID=42345 RepID=A0A8B7BZX0_PHODC|nr:reticuline oxidase-like [Phoenix dactylifera]